MRPFIMVNLVTSVFLFSAINVATASTDATWTYWFDETCEDYQLDVSMAETQAMARSAADRIFDGNDVLAGTYYELIFKTPRQLQNAAQPDDQNLLDEIAVAGMFKIDLRTS